MAILSVTSVFFCAAITLCSADCGTFFGSGVEDADKNVIVDKHNELRGLISQGAVPDQPKGTNLKTLSWDDKLADAAQNIANTCELAHVGVDDDRFSVGQNLGWTGESTDSPENNWSGIVEMWFDEHKNFVYPHTSNGTTGHYTQVVWADTYLIGCGFSWYRNNEWYSKLYVCNYGPAGNIGDQAPYEV